MNKNLENNYNQQVFDALIQQIQLNILILSYREDFVEINTTIHGFIQDKQPN